MSILPVFLRLDDHDFYSFVRLLIEAYSYNFSLLNRCSFSFRYSYYKCSGDRLATIHQRYRQDRQTDRQTGQPSDSVGRTVLQTVVQKPKVLQVRKVIETVVEIRLT